MTESSHQRKKYMQDDPCQRTNASNGSQLAHNIGSQHVIFFIIHNLFNHISSYFTKLIMSLRSTMLSMNVWDTID